MLNDYKGGKGGEQQTSMHNGKRLPDIFCKRKDYGMIGEYTEGFDASKPLLKSLLPIHRLKQSVSLKLSYYRPQGYHKFGCW